MSIELVRNSAENNLSQASGLMSAAAEMYERKAEAWLVKHPDVDPDAEGFEHSNAATFDRYREVYSSTAQVLEEVLLNHRRNLVRAGNPYYANKTDEEIDAILAQQD